MMKRFFIWISLLILLFSSTKLEAQLAERDTTLILMGTRFSLKAVAENKKIAEDCVLKGIDEIRRIEKLTSTYMPNTQVDEVNRMAGVAPVKVDQELIQLVERAKKVSTITDGAFDVTFDPLYHIWKFNQKMNAWPPEDSIAKYRSLVNYRFIELDNEKHTIFLKQKGMSMSFGAIGKGYAANRASLVMKKMGAQGGFADASGDILFWGNNVDGNPWSVAIASPVGTREVIGYLNTTNMAVVTSGNAEQNFKWNGKTYSHIIDPQTGYPVVETVSVTIICPDAELADALATAVSVLGVENGLKLVNSLKGVECLIVDSQMKMHQSGSLKLVPIR